MLDKNSLGESLRGIAELIWFDEIDSTNTEAKRMARAASVGDREPKLLVARAQSGGRGRLGREFLSRRDSGVYFSLLYYTDKPLCDVISITTAAAVTVAGEIEHVSGIDAKIKWVNDIYNESGKVSGLLVETLRVDSDTVAVIVGIGINVGEVDFPESLRGIASTIGDVGGRECELVSEIARGLLSFASDPCDRSYMAEYRRRFMLTGEMVNLLRDGEIACVGRVEGVDDEGGLLLIPLGESEMITIRTGEVSVRRINKR